MRCYRSVKNEVVLHLMPCQLGINVAVPREVDITHQYSSVIVGLTNQILAGEMSCTKRL